jgi:hypothetical protein
VREHFRQNRHCFISRFRRFPFKAKCRSRKDYPSRC